MWLEACPSQCNCIFEGLLGLFCGDGFCHDVSLMQIEESVISMSNVDACNASAVCSKFLASFTFCFIFLYLYISVSTGTWFLSVLLVNALALHSPHSSVIFFCSHPIWVSALTVKAKLMAQTDLSVVLSWGDTKKNDQFLSKNSPFDTFRRSTEMLCLHYRKLLSTF